MYQSEPRPCKRLSGITPNQRLLLPGKNNLTAEGQGLAFMIAGDLPALQWEPAPVPLTATAALADETTPSIPPACQCPLHDPVHEWLRALLTNGPMSAADARREADDAGCRWRTVRRAQDDLGIRSMRPGASRPRFWHLPND